MAQEKVTKENGLKVQPFLASSPAMQFFDRTSVSCRKTAVVLTAALRVYDLSGRFGADEEQQSAIAWVEFRLLPGARYRAREVEEAKMKNTKLPELTFAWLDAQIEALPAGPAAILSTPRWTRYWTMIGVAGLVSVLLPSLLLHLQWWQVDRWMVTQAQIGLAIAVLGFAPGFARNIWVLVQGFRHQRRGLIEQFDHDTRKFRALSEELSAYPRVVLERQSRQAAMGHERLTGQLVILLGGIERLGLLPLLLSLFVVLRNWEDLLALPLWLAMLGIMAPILWLIGWGGAEFRRRLQLYEFLLDEALIVQGIRNEKAGKREQRVTEGPKTS